MMNFDGEKVEQCELPQGLSQTAMCTTHNTVILYASTELQTNPNSWEFHMYTAVVKVLEPRGFERDCLFSLVKKINRLFYR
jgi:hypothetical protein